MQSLYIYSCILSTFKVDKTRYALDYVDISYQILYNNPTKISIFIILIVHYNSKRKRGEPMSFFRRLFFNSFCKYVKIENVYVAEADTISSYNDGTGTGPKISTSFFLVTRKKDKVLPAFDKFYELFSGKQLKSEAENNAARIFVKTFDTPYVVKVTPLKDFLVHPEKKKMNVELLFDFITKMNIDNSLGAFDEENEEE